MTRSSTLHTGTAGPQNGDTSANQQPDLIYVQKVGANDHQVWQGFGSASSHGLPWHMREV